MEASEPWRLLARRRKEELLWDVTYHMTSFDFIDASFGGKASSEWGRGQKAKDQSLEDRE